jgi:hypothetical protein
LAPTPPSLTAPGGGLDGQAFRDSRDTQDGAGARSGGAGGATGNSGGSSGGNSGGNNNP